MNKLDEIMKESIKEFNYKVGDRVKLHLKVSEGDTERIQIFDGIIMAIRGSGVSRSFTVRKISYGVGVERTFPVNSPKIEKIELVKSNKVRRAKLNYLRKLSGKAARLSEIEMVEDAEEANQEMKQQETQVKEANNA
ncbi:MAG: 50S ribosomal protein L19 [Elusimicrobiales bacterium]